MEAKSRNKPQAIIPPTFGMAPSSEEPLQWAPTPINIMACTTLNMFIANKIFLEDSIPPNILIFLFEIDYETKLFCVE